MNKICILKSQEWIKTVGKSKIQCFQDCFADMFNITLGIFSPDGKPMTVYSNSSLFCHYIITNNRDRCNKEHQHIIERILSKKDTIIYTCYTGITYFACPIFLCTDIVAICMGGGVYLEENKEEHNSNHAKVIPSLSKAKLEDIIKLLENTFNLININENTNFDDENKKQETKYDLFFLANKLSLREIEIVRHINEGLTNKEISMKLNISEKTVKTHITNILRKLNMKDRLEIVIFCKNYSLDS